MRLSTLVMAALVAVVLAAPATAATLKVPKDYETIQAAADAAEPGDKIVVSKGTYHEIVVVAKSDIQFIGKKAVWDGIIDGLYGTCLNATGDDIVVQGFRFRHGEDQVYITGHRAVITKCTFINSGDNPVQVTGDDARVEKCTMTGMDNDAVNITGPGALVSKNKIGNGGDGGIYVSGDDAVVAGNQVNVIEDDDAIYVSGDRARVEKNTCWNADGSGVEVSGEDAFVARNKISYTYDEGIDISGDGATVDRNVVLGSEGRGIYVSGDDFTVTGNKVSHCIDDEDGIYVNGSATGEGTAVVERNKVQDVVEDAFNISGDGIRIIGNVALRSGSEDDAGFYVSGSNNFLSGNKAIDIDSDGFQIRGDDNVIEKCVAQGCTDDGFEVGSEYVGNRIEGCTAKANDGEGIENFGFKTVVTGSKFSGNRLDVTSDGYYDEFTGNKYKTGGEETPAEVDPVD
ncbi:MAG: right-handed parallel beta-helix repeat-containing protein [Planctomycetota bacterium]